MLRNKKELITLINHFDKYPLLTQKAADFMLFKQVIKLMIDKKHLSIEGLYQIINIKASINLGLSDFLKTEFKERSRLPSIERPVINTESIPDPNWFAGFVTGEGNFDVKITPDSTFKIGYRVTLRFRVVQHERDKKLMECLAKFLKAGNIYKHSEKHAVVLSVTKFSDIYNIIVPFFEQNPLLGIKLFDYLDWCKVANIMNKGSHLTIEGLNLIRELKAGMNRGRKYEV